MNLSLRFIALLLPVLILLAGCESEPSLSSYEMRVLQYRFEKDMQLRDPQRTVLRQQEQDTFKALNYFPVDSTYRFAVPLIRSEEPEVVQFQRRMGDMDAFVRIGFIEIPVDGAMHRLMVFQPEDPRDTSLWIPFADATSNRDTYGGGRYLDGMLDENGMVLVDFNMAYNPLCDYNPNFNCAMPPSANRLPVAVPAGEKRSLLLDM